MGIGASLRLDNIKVSLTKIQLFDFIDKIKECLNWLYITKKKSIRILSIVLVQSCHLEMKWFRSYL